MCCARRIIGFCRGELQALKVGLLSAGSQLVDDLIEEILGKDTLECLSLIVDDGQNRRSESFDRVAEKFGPDGTSKALLPFLTNLDLDCDGHE